MRDFENNLRPFHLAIPVSDIEKSKKFYQDILECNIGRSTDNWIDFNLFGHQLVIHLVFEIVLRLSKSLYRTFPYKLIKLVSS